MDRIFRAMRNTGRARQAGEMAQTPTSVGIQFLFIGSRLCSTLLSDLTSRFGPCASLLLHLHLVVKRSCTSKLSIMLGTPRKNGESLIALSVLCNRNWRGSIEPPKMARS
jgi:hypothetical protein